MDFALSTDQVFIKDTLHRFLQRECPREKAHELDEQGTFPGELLARIAEIGFCGLNVPEAFDGSGQDLVGTAIGIEEIAAASPVLAMLFASVSLCGGRVISRFGSPAQQQEYLPQISRGKLKFSFGFEDELARDGMQVSLNGESYILSGRASCVPFTNPALADYLFVQARNHEDQNNISLFIVPLDVSGLQIQAMPTVGMRGIGFGEIIFDQVQLNAEQVLGGPQCFGQATNQLEYLAALDQICGAAIGLGVAQGAYEYALDYARERSQFGQTLLQFEAVENMLVDEAVNLQSTRWLLYHACWLADQDKSFALEAAMARLQAGNLARQAGLQSVHILGGYGYMAEYDAQRSMRDALAIFPGGESSELLKTKIGKQLHSL
ncbi:MAG TPA: acyl-CoA dehydrogenase family protein [Anaerolineales bacterium]